MNDRKAAEARGRRSERVASLWLGLKGYRTLASRVRTPVGEIDLIVQKGRLVAFVEVKQRADRDAALASVSPAAWRRIDAAAAYWMARRADLSGAGWRYDLVALAPGRWPVHVADAWRGGLA
jgi:putative endonuclease